MEFEEAKSVRTSHYLCFLVFVFLFPSSFANISLLSHTAFGSIHIHNLYFLVVNSIIHFQSIPPMIFFNIIMRLNK